MIATLFAMSIALAQSSPGIVYGPPKPPPTARETYDAMVEAAALVDPAPRDDSRDQQRRMASSDRDDTRFFNRPGATRADYDTQWRTCQQIGRRLASPRNGGGPMQAGFTHGGLVGGMLAGGLDAAFSQRRARHDIRRQCLVASGYRLVLPDEAGRRLIAAMPRDARDAWLDRMLAAEQVEVGGRVLDWDALVRAGGIRGVDEAEDD